MTIEDDSIYIDLEEIVIVGNKRTKTSYFSHEILENVLRNSGKKPINERTARDYIQSLQQFTSKLMNANLFDHVDSDLQIKSGTDGRYKVRHFDLKLTLLMQMPSSICF
jgi:hypothetical protein